MILSIVLAISIVVSAEAADCSRDCRAETWARVPRILPSQICAAGKAWRQCLDTLLQADCRVESQYIPELDHADRSCERSDSSHAPATPTQPIQRGCSTMVTCSKESEILATTSKSRKCQLALEWRKCLVGYMDSCNVNFPFELGDAQAKNCGPGVSDIIVEDDNNDNANEGKEDEKDNAKDGKKHGKTKKCKKSGKDKHRKTDCDNDDEEKKKRKDNDKIDSVGGADQRTDDKDNVAKDDQLEDQKPEDSLSYDNNTSGEPDKDTSNDNEPNMDLTGQDMDDKGADDEQDDNGPGGNGTDVGGSDIDGSDGDGSDVVGSDVDGSGGDGSDVDGSGGDGSDDDGSDGDGSDVVGSDVDGSGGDGSDVDGSGGDGSDDDGSDVDGSGGDGSDDASLDDKEEEKEIPECDEGLAKCEDENSVQLKTATKDLKCSMAVAWQICDEIFRGENEECKDYKLDQSIKRTEGHCGPFIG